MTTDGTQYGGSLSGPIQGIELPESEPLEIDLDIRLPEDDTIDPVVDYPTSTSTQEQRHHEESENRMPIGDAELWNYKLHGVDSDGSSRICVTDATTTTPTGSSSRPTTGTASTSSQQTRTNSTSHTRNDAVIASSGPPTTFTATDTTRTSAQSDEVIQPGTPPQTASRLHAAGGAARDPSGQSAPGASGGQAHPSNTASNGNDEDEERGIHHQQQQEQNDLEKSTETNSSNEKTTESLTVALERSPALRWFVIGILALILIAGVALAGIICGTGGCSSKDEDPKSNGSSNNVVGSDAEALFPTELPATPTQVPTLSPTITNDVPVSDTEQPTHQIPTNNPTNNLEEPSGNPLPSEGGGSENNAQSTLAAATAGPTIVPSVDIFPTELTTESPTSNPSPPPTMTTTTTSPTTETPTTTTNPTTNSPTQAPSINPTASLPITPSPTTIVPNVPTSTLEAMQDFSTPQGKALFWIQDYPNFVSLPDWRKRQLFAMVTLWFAFNGPTWPLSRRFQWLEYSVNECEWRSIQTSPCDLDGQLEFLGFLNDPNLQGTMPQEVGFLTQLEELSVVDCGLQGTAETLLPSLVTESLVNLRRLHFEGNALTGSLPSTSLVNFTNLQYLYLQDNPWSGTLPSQIGQLTNLKGLDLSNTGLTGTIPVEWGALTALEALHLADTSISGTIPQELCDLPLLTTMEADCDRVVCCQ